MVRLCPAIGLVGAIIAPVVLTSSVLRRVALIVLIVSVAILHAVVSIVLAVLRVHAVTIVIVPSVLLVLIVAAIPLVVGLIVAAVLIVLRRIAAILRLGWSLTILTVVILPRRPVGGWLIVCHAAGAACSGSGWWSGD